MCDTRAVRPYSGVIASPRVHSQKLHKTMLSTTELISKIREGEKLWVVHPGTPGRTC